MWNNYRDYRIETKGKSHAIVFGDVPTQTVYFLSDDDYRFLKQHRNYRIVPINKGAIVKFRFGFASDSCLYVGSWQEVLIDIAGLYREEKEVGHIL